MVLRAAILIRPATFAACCLSVLLLACSVSPARPDLALPEQTPGQWQALVPEAENSATMMNWWASWNDPTLSALLAQAQQHSASLAQATARIAQARASATAAGAALWPNLDFHASLISSRDPSLGLAAKQSIQTTGLDARWEIDLFGANAAARNGMLARVDARESEWHDARISLAAEVANNYLALRSCEAQAADLQQLAESQQVSLQLQQQKIAAGFIAPLELAQQRAVLAGAVAQVQQQQTDCHSLLKALVVLIDLPEPALHELLKAGSARLPQASNFVVDTLPVQVLLQRPDLRAAMHNLMANAADIEATKARRYPSISLLGSINLLGIRIAGQAEHDRSWSFGPSLTLPLFDAGARKADVDFALARQAEAQAAFRQKTLLAVQEVEEAMIRLDLANRHLQQHQYIETVQLNKLLAAETGWRLGNVNLLEKEEARRQQLEAQRSKWQLQRARASAWIALYKAVGGDWQQAAKQPGLP